MKKWILTGVGTLLALGMALPAAAEETGLPGFAASIAEGARQGLTMGAQAAVAGMDAEFDVALMTDSVRIEEEQGVCLSIAISNPRAQETPVTVTLNLPEMLTADGETTFDVLLPAAQLDTQTMALAPSQTVITRMLTLKAGSCSEETEIGAELAVGTRFYRASTPLSVCVPDISVRAAAEGADENGRIQPGDTFAYVVTVENAGAAGKTLPMRLTLPLGACCTELPVGFEQKDGAVTGSIEAGAADDGEPWQMTLRFILQAKADALGGEQTRQLLSGALTADARPVSLPKLEVCRPNVNASLSADKNSLTVGEEMELSLIVTNTGLVPADVQLTCRLPQGLTLVTGREQEDDEKEKSTAAPVPQNTDDTDGDAPAQAVLADAGETLADVDETERVIRMNLRMEAAGETEDGLAAAARRVTLRVRADAPMEDVKEQLLGTSMTFAADDGEAQLGDALAVRVVRNSFFGLSREQTSNLFWAVVLLGVTLSCMFAVFSGDDEECAE